MKTAVFAFVCLVSLARPAVIVAQIDAPTYTPGELAATAVVAKSQATADAIRLRIDAPTATPTPSRTPTDTPTPSPTAVPLPTATDTPAPAPTGTSVPTSASTSAPMVTPVAMPTPMPMAASSSDRTARYILAGLVVAIVIAAVWVFLFRPQVFILPNRRR